MMAVVVLGGTRLARREESIRIERDREALRRFFGDAEEKLQSLDTWYQEHLVRLADSPSSEPFELRHEAELLVGVREFSLLHPVKSGITDTHLTIMRTPLERTPQPAFVQKPGTVGTVVLLDEDKLFGDGAKENGWIEEPGKPLMFAGRRSGNEVAVIIIDRPSVQDAMDQDLKAWAETKFEQVRVAGGPDQFRSGGSRVLAIAGHPTENRPDLLLPLASRFGQWDLVSWDPRKILVHYDQATLLVTATIGLAMAVLGATAFIQQRTALALAAQRVSFVNRVSHELRTPLTNMLLNIDLATDAAEELPRDVGRRLALVKEEASRLGRLIENVLTFSRNEEGKLRLHPCACVPASVVSAVAEQFAASFKRHGLELRRTDENSGAACLLDADALAQVLGNLLSNVEKYVPSGAVEIVTKVSEGVLSIRVSDEGPGIPRSAAEQVFRPFERLDSSIREGVSGTGLGLAIARDLARRMGGSLRLVPSTRGASFELRIPAPSAPTPGVLSVA